jgi:hypothetical protein
MRSNIFLKIILALLISVTSHYSVIYASNKETNKANNLATKNKKSIADKVPANWPENSGVDAWNDEEFEDDLLCDDLNSKDDLVVNFDYLLRCIK